MLWNKFFVTKIILRLEKVMFISGGWWGLFCKCEVFGFSFWFFAAVWYLHWSQIKFEFTLGSPSLMGKTISNKNNFVFKKIQVLDL